MARSWPIAEPASEEYAYIDPKKAHYGIARLGERYHPLDVYDKFDRPPPKFGVYLLFPVFGAALACIGVAGQNYYTKKPVISQLWKYAVFCGLGAYFGHSVFNYNAKVANRNDAIYRHYLETHYDDFPVVERMKYKDIFKGWIPIRG
ncbi:hypothetical protein HDE_10085 [Halotydeus destructor]|nr:hypothetical protein HDE_10085 [Halotydeus destructor]